MAVDPDIRFYMRIPLGDGTFTNGKIDYPGHPAMLGIADIDLTGKRVLDIAANDGFWSFWAEQRGAEVVAIDVDSFDGYDWGYDGPSARSLQRSAASPFAQWSEAGRGFAALHEHFGSSVERLSLSVYDLDPDTHGHFDLIFNYGLLYHLRHPLLSLDRVRRVCRGALVLETHVVNTFSRLPISFFYWDDVFRGETNWTGPTEAGVATWLRSAGFHLLRANRPNMGAPYARGIFAASTTQEWMSAFESPRLRTLDDDYFAEVYRDTQGIVQQGRP